MTGPHAVWIRTYAGKLDRSLRRELINGLRVSRWMPCTFVGTLIRMKQYVQRVPIILRTHTSCSERERIQMVQQLSRTRCKGTCDLPIIGGIATSAPMSVIEQIAADPRVRSVVLDRPVHALLDVAAPTVGAPSVWQEGLTGDGVTVAVVDTGIFPHDDVETPKSRLVAFADFVLNRRTPYDDNGHGTHVAGIVAGNGSRSQGVYRGIAPNANLAGVKVLDAQGNGTLSTVIRGIQWCVQQKEAFNIRVINLSLGAPVQGSYEDDPVAQAVGAAWEKGLVVCAAAGNDGPGDQSVSTPGIHPRIITVGAIDDHETVTRADDTVAPFSSRGSTPEGVVKPDVVAPGTEIVAPNATNSTLARQHGAKYQDYITLSGTSMATPICSGIVALMLERNPALTPDTVKEHLVNSAEILDAARDGQGSGLVNARNAVTPGAEANSDLNSSNA